MAHAELQKFRGEAKFTTWLWRVVVNAAHDRRRRAATRTRHAEGWGDWETARTTTNAESAARIDWLHQAMNGLPNDLRDTLALILDDVTHKDAAEILGVTEGTVSWRISEAKKTLRAIRAREDQI